MSLPKFLRRLKDSHRSNACVRLAMRLAEAFCRPGQRLRLSATVAAVEIERKQRAAGLVPARQGRPERIARPYPGRV